MDGDRRQFQFGVSRLERPGSSIQEGCSLAVFGPKQEELATGQAPCKHLFLSSNEN